MFGMKKIRGEITAKSPLHHGGNEKTGSVVMFNRMKYMTDDGSFQDIPFISGNAIRGVLRRMIVQDFFEKLDYKLDVSSKKQLRLYHAFYAGGVLETVDTKDSGVIDVELKRKIIDYFPPIRLLGFSLRNQIIPSKLKVSHMLPICTELQNILPRDTSPKHSFYELLTTGFQTRKDDLHAKREEGEQSIQMLVEYELFSPGTKFHHEFRIEDPDEIDVACLSNAIKLWMEKPYIGGKSSVGLGEVELNYTLDVDEKKYIDYIESNRDEIISTLESL